MVALSSSKKNYICSSSNLVFITFYESCCYNIDSPFYSLCNDIEKFYPLASGYDGSVPNFM